MTNTNTIVIGCPHLVSSCSQTHVIFTIFLKIGRLCKIWKSIAAEFKFSRKKTVIETLLKKKESIVESVLTSIPWSDDESMNVEGIESVVE
jgi:hypothetical protein